MEKLIKKIKFRLGEPIIKVDITDEQIITLFEIANKEWELYDSFRPNPNGVSRGSVKENWVFSYATALSKELLARIKSIRVKDDGVGVVALDYHSLLNESKEEKNKLIGLLM
jgi:hypothetical protein